jgi:hypothetical protein
MADTNIKPEQRVITGYLTAHDDNGPGYELGSGAGFGNFWEGPAHITLRGVTALPCTLIIGDGKVYTEEQVRGMLKEVCMSALEFELHRGLPGMLIQPGDVMHIAAKHGITNL